MDGVKQGELTMNRQPERYFLRLLDDDLHEYLSVEIRNLL